MGKLQDDIEELGGLASMAELLQRGHWRERIKIALMYRKVIRVRRGWYAVPGEPGPVMSAWRVGGRLACVSAVAYWRGDRPTAELHVEVRANAAHLRSPRDVTRPLASDDWVIVHWSHAPRAGTRRAVSLRAAQLQADRCKAKRQAASSDSASRIV